MLLKFNSFTAFLCCTVLLPSHVVSVPVFRLFQSCYEPRSASMLCTARAVFHATAGHSGVGYPEELEVCSLSPATLHLTARCVCSVCAPLVPRLQLICCQKITQMPVALFSISSSDERSQSANNLSDMIWGNSCGCFKIKALCAFPVGQFNVKQQQSEIWTMGLISMRYNYKQ